MIIQLLKKDGKYSVRQKVLWFIWVYEQYDGFWFCPEWTDYETAKSWYDNIIKSCYDHKKFRSSTIEIKEQSVI